MTEAESGPPSAIGAPPRKTLPVVEKPSTGLLARHQAETHATSVIASNASPSRKSEQAAARNVGLEAVRGAAAMTVVLCHLDVVPGFMQRIGSASMLLNWGTEAVALFFLLSGAVVHLSVDRSRRSVGGFLAARAVRLLPLYFVAVATAVLLQIVFEAPPSVRTVLGNAAFLQSLQNFICPVLDANPPLWSLSFEIVFYLVFALTMKFPRKLLWVWALGAIGCAASQFSGAASGVVGHVQLVGAYSTIWLLGYFVVDLAPRINVGAAVGAACLAMLPMAARLPLGTTAEYYLAAKHLLAAATAAPLFIVMLRQNAGKETSESRGGWTLCVTSYAVLAALLLTTSGSHPASKAVYLLLPPMAAAASMAAKRAGFRFGRLRPAALFLGRISYALYLFHYPVFYAGRALRLSGLSGAMILLPAALLAAFIAEYHLHPILCSLPTRLRRWCSKDDSTTDMSDLLEARRPEGAAAVR